MNRMQADIQSIIEKKELFERLKDSTVLITGATGFIGSMLMKTLYAASNKYGLDIKIIGQVRNIKKTKEIFRQMIDDVKFVVDADISCDYIIHTVSPTTSKFFIEHPVETIRISVESLMEILEVTKKNNAVLVYLSSMEQYGMPYVSEQHMTEDKIGVIDHLNVRRDRKSVV